MVFIGVEGGFNVEMYTVEICIFIKVCTFK